MDKHHHSAMSSPTSHKQKSVYEGLTEDEKIITDIMEQTVCPMITDAALNYNFSIQLDTQPNCLLTGTVFEGKSSVIFSVDKKRLEHGDDGRLQQRLYTTHKFVDNGDCITFHQTDSSKRNVSLHSNEPDDFLVHIKRFSKLLSATQQNNHESLKVSIIPL